MPNLHPLIVHFPIALLLTNVALDWAGLVWKNRSFAQAAWYALLLGLAATVFTLVTGLIAAQGVPADSPAMSTLNAHKILGIVAFVLFAVLTVWRWRSKGTYSPIGRALHSAVQLTGVALIVVLGYMGGELVYTFGIGVAALAR